uniref:Uncharacterized protein n=1 Tax=Candidatus Methanogaster sp. ANME-2c ERB4 TaxID=2759911 RepID=A0A7G9Y2M8_9EURY|nr:hypothetical protein OICIIDJB_00002 [Methanosarcinales archaeon ANME-2c ERB4]QNO43097.1 hypothetical protein MLBHKIFI_00002 [Methanosarcinales archaeon ANME-2c ERB4]QNO43287.1 hypothetical protein CFCDKGLG_00006 [Methanosarcinales archaeon ANME-2c ERB4]QNO45336.1 hypothetical protein MAODPDDD_00005 [Methanosarcinales archaeon ANME-2c ERB4]QNO45497.1 hypothetical protein PALFMHCA_00007 [Methanosarcinales archaeon ANME-2c ERB4]
MKSILMVVYLSVLFLSIAPGIVSGEDARSNNSHVYSTMEPPVSAPIVVENLSADCDGVIKIPVNINRTAVPAGDVMIAGSSARSVDRVSSGVVYSEVRSFSVDSAARNEFIVKTAENISSDSDPTAMTSHSFEPDVTCAGGNATVLSGMLPETFEVKSVELKGAGQEPVYEVIATKEVRILGLVPVSMDIEMVVDASNGEIGVTKKPWWGFLCSGGV